MSKGFSQILIYTRPLEVHFHLALAAELAKAFPSARLRFATFFSWAARRVEAKGFSVVYLPTQLAKVTGAEVSDARFREIDEELYKETGANINLMLQSERFLPTEPGMAELFCRKHLAVLDSMVTPGTLSVSSMFDHYVYWLAGSLANARGGAHFAFTPCGVPANRTIALRTPWKTWRVPVTEDPEAVLRDSIAALSLPASKRINYMREPARESLAVRAQRRRMSFEMYRSYCRDTQAGSYFRNAATSPLHYFLVDLPWRRLQRLLPSGEIAHHEINSTKDLDSIGGRFCYLPLHLEPEASTLMWSPWLRDQYEACRLVCGALPAGWRLLVKENPKMLGLRSPGFYEKVRALPHTLLVNPALESTELILRCDVTAALAGTALLEASLLGRPAICLGRPSFRALCSASDIAASLPLSELSSIIGQARPALTMELWADWLAGTVRASSCPERSNGYHGIDSSKSNVETFISYMLAAIREA